MPEVKSELPFSFSAELSIGRERVKLQASFSSEKARASELVPFLQSLTDKIVSVGINEIEASGARISCSKGCSACCAQLVPVSEPEARYLLQLVDTFPKQRQARIRRRYNANRKILEASGLLDRLSLGSVGSDRRIRRKLGVDYFKLGLRCPFLEHDCCSIHLQRPLSCREFLVTSLPEHCASNDPGNVIAVSYPRRASVVLYRFGDGIGEADTRVLPLSLLFDWSQSQGNRAEPEFDLADYCGNFLRKLSLPQGDGSC